METLVQQWLEHGKQQGWLESLQQGWLEGLHKGQQEGVQQGVMLKAREDIFTVLGLRFGALPVEVVQTLNKLDDVDRLTALHKTAVLAASLDEFAAQLSL